MLIAELGNNLDGVEAGDKGGREVEGMVGGRSCTSRYGGIYFISLNLLLLFSDDKVILLIKEFSKMISKSNFQSN